MRWQGNMLIDSHINLIENNEKYALMLHLEELAKDAGLRDFLTEIKIPGSIQYLIDSKADEDKALMKDGALDHTGTTAGFYGTTPTVQAAAIPDAVAGTVVSTINSILAVLRALGLIAT